MASSRLANVIFDEILETQAAVTVARRVAEERNCRVGAEVGYAIRFDEQASSSTRIKYMTGDYDQEPTTF